MQTLVLNPVSVPSTVHFATRPTFVAIETSSYSGATLLAFLLSAHPEIASIGEMNGVIASEDIETYRCSCGERIQVCEFWKAVRAAMQQRGFHFNLAYFDMQFLSEHPGLIRQLHAGSFRNETLDALRDVFVQALPGETRAVKQQTARNVAFVESILQVTGKRVFVDSAKDHLRAKLLEKFSALDVRAIHLVRDPRGVIASRLRRGVNVSTRQAAREWVRLHERLEWMLKALPRANVMRVRYEDFASDPQGTLKPLYAFCGVAPDFTLTDLRAVEHHIVGNPMRLHNTTEIRLDASWRERLTRVQIDDIWRVAGDAGARYGYI